jgi:putative transcription factor
MALCEMCAQDTKLVSAEVDGAELNVCSNCAKYGTIKKKVNKFTPPSHFRNRNSNSKKEKVEFRIVNDFSDLIRNSRNKRVMTQEDFAKFLNEKESIVAKWESGSLKPRLDVARTLERKLNIRLVEKDEIKQFEGNKNKVASEFTLGDFIKVRKRG